MMGDGEKDQSERKKERKKALGPVGVVPAGFAFAGCLGTLKTGAEPAQECAVLRGAETSQPRIHSERSGVWTASLTVAAAGKSSSLQ